MKIVLKQAAGIDVAKSELVVTLGKIFSTMEIELIAHKTFPNTPNGFISLLAWSSKLTSPDFPIRYVVEATGVYHEKLVYFLSDKKQSISVILPNKINNYAKTLDIKTVTDKTASQAIVSFALERKLDDWIKPAPTFRNIKQLTRERSQLVEERTMQKNQLHAEKSEAFPNTKSIERITERTELINSQIKEVQKDITALIKQDEALSKQIDRITTIPGVGTLTAITILGETNGFELIRNKRQLVSYAGLDVKEKLSGTSVKGKPKISKRGNRHVRKAMYMPALAAIRTEERFGDIFSRLVSKHGIKMKAAVAIQRKLLELIYIIWKTERPYESQNIRNTQTYKSN